MSLRVSAPRALISACSGLMYSSVPTMVPYCVNRVHHGQGLPLGLEAGDDLAGIHAGLDDLEGDLALDRVGLLGHEDGAHAAFADLLQELVRADHGAGFFRAGRAVAGRCRVEERL